MATGQQTHASFNDLSIRLMV